MSAQSILRPRSPKRRARRLRMAFAPAGAVSAAPAGSPPHLGFRAEESGRAALLSGSLTTLLHAGVIALLLLFAWMAPDVKDVVIPVTVLKEAPGSREAPAPKALAPRRPAAADLAAAVARTPLPPDAPNPLSPEVFEQAQVARAQVPESFERRQLDAQRLEARKTIDAPRPLDVATLSPTKVSPSELRAPSFQYEGPRAVDTRARVESLSPEAFAAPKPVVRDYRGAANQVVQAPATTAAGPPAPGADTHVSGRWLGGGEGTGGTGTAIGTVRCEESAPVARYYDEMQRRASARWEVPPDAPTDQPVVLRFQLDVSGSVTHVEFVKAASPALGESAVHALRAASPFPPLDDDVRECLSGPLLATFDVPSL
jgi:TonB family protein